ncbi:3-hydroxyisobutyrate dehydrogenase [Bacillus manliponensis]|uniref:3-hydroxyisobutyrate dehydrogenase n=1 Tax=Bacillus manliponensis TaxID=574376 RepID=A0A073JSS7_9BACI|nr:hypothetical protein [Bacillus manliponensis]KEK17360.1 3-hydroxyisobutyrate dehydrogenase [Bacillus manliponensis]
MIKKVIFYILAFILGTAIWVILGIVNPKLGESVGSIFMSMYLLVAYYDFMNSPIARQKVLHNKKVESATLYGWVTGKHKGYYQLENKIFQGGAKKEFLDNLRLIRYQLLKLGKEDAKLLQAHLKVLDKNESYMEFFLKVIASLVVGLFLWYVKSSIFTGTTTDHFEELVDSVTYGFFVLITIASLIGNNLEYCYKTRILIELLDSIEDEEYL